MSQRLTNAMSIVLIADGTHYSTLTSRIITLVVGHEQRLFAAHEDVLSLSPFFTAALQGQFFESASKRVELPDEYGAAAPIKPYVR